MPRFPSRLALAAFIAFVVAGATAASGSRGTSTEGVIVFAADRSPAVAGEIYRVGPDGRRIDLSRSPTEDSQPLLSPDGRKVAFFSQRHGAIALYVVGSDGTGLTRVSHAWHLTSSSDVVDWDYVWAPDSERLAVVTAYPAPAGLYVMQPGRPARFISRLHARPQWSPDGRLITTRTLGPGPNNRLVAFTPEGKPAWRVRIAGGYPAWSARERIAVPVVGGIAVFDQRGHPLNRFRGRAFVWSPRGDRIASVFRSWLEVRTGAGSRVVFKRTVPVLGAYEHAGLMWPTSHRLVVSSFERSFVFDISTGRTSRLTSLYPAGYMSHDGKFVGATKRVGSGFALRVSRIDGSGTRTLARVPGCWDDGVFGPAVSDIQIGPAGRFLVYQSACAEPFHNLYSIRADGTGLRRLTRAGEEETEPQVSPDGSRIAYSRADFRDLSCKGCPATIWVRDADGSHPRQLIPTHAGTFDRAPRWSPTGREIAFTREYLTAPDELFVVSANGGRARNLHLGGQLKWGGPWSRDGRLASIEGGGGRIVIDVTGGGRIRLPLVHADGVAWSPDGRQLVLTARASSTAPSDVYVVDVDGRHLRRLTRNLNATGVSWR